MNRGSLPRGSVFAVLGGYVLLPALCCPVLSAQPANQSTQQRPPNIILILCDNLGYGDVGCFNAAAKQRTPRIDRIAAEGMKFTDCYAAAPVCTPSRAALMTGCYPRRVGLDYTNPDGLVLRPVSRIGLHPDEVTIAELLQTRGYATACIGKWHLGDQPLFLPTRQGFDYYLGIPYSDDMVARPSQPTWPPLPLMEGEKVIESPVDRNLLTKRYTQRAIRFIEEHRQRPFFIYLPHAMPGSTASPFASEAFRGKSGNGPWGDSVVEIDWSTGQILDALKRLDLDEQTLVIWTNDNGAPVHGRRGGSNLPLKGNAYSVAEGGMRVPLIARWPGRIPAGTVCREVITLMDLYPSLAHLAGAKAPTDRIIDGRDIRPLMFGEPGATSPHKAFFYYYANQLQAVRSGPWKLNLPPGGRLGPSAQSPIRLVNLVDDPQETTNLSRKQPDVVQRLQQRIEEARQDLGELDRKGANVRPVGKVDAAAPVSFPSTDHFWYRPQPAGPYIDSQRDNKAFGFADGMVFLSEDNGRTWPHRIAFPNAQNITFSCILRNGNILFATRARLYLSTNNLKTYNRVTLKDADGVDYIPHAPENADNPGWYFHPLDGVHTWDVNGKEMLVWGNYCNVIGGAAPVNIYYSTDNGQTVKIAYAFGQNPSFRDNGSAGGGGAGTLLGDPDNPVICRHIHSVAYNPAENAFYACTGDHDFAGGHECHWLRGTYDTTKDKWHWTVLVSDSPNSRYKSGGINFADGELYWIADANGPKPHDRGIFRCDPADIAKPETHTRLFNPQYEAANMIIQDGVILASHYATASPYATGFIVSLDMGQTWAQYDLKEFGKRSPVRFHEKNSDGWFRVDLRSGWIKRAEMLFIKPKEAFDAATE